MSKKAKGGEERRSFVKTSRAGRKKNYYFYYSEKERKKKGGTIGEGKEEQGGRLLPSFKKKGGVSPSIPSRGKRQRERDLVHARGGKGKKGARSTPGHCDKGGGKRISKGRKRNKGGRDQSVIEEGKKYDN